MKTIIIYAKGPAGATRYTVTLTGPDRPCRDQVTVTDPDGVTVTDPALIDRVLRLLAYDVLTEGR